MRHISYFIILVSLLFGVFLVGCESKNHEASAKSMSDAERHQKAEELAHKFIITDGHIDVPYRLTEFMEDISVRTAGGDFDYVRAKEGGLNAPFMSIYIPAKLQKTGGAKALADSLIDMVEGFQRDHPDKFAVAKSVADVRAQFKKGLVSLPMGMENGAPVEGNLENLKHFYDRGIRYITLTHSKVNHICDSSYDSTRTWNGLSPFGEKVVAEMNRLGIMVDVSHISDSTFYDVMKISKAPVIASHSSCRFYTPGWERNMTDEMIKLLAEKDGVICINFGSDFLKAEYDSSYERGNAAVEAYLEEHHMTENSPEGHEYKENYRRSHPVGTVGDVVDNIDHVVQLVGIDHVGLGSDYDGVFSLPKGAQDVSGYPNIIDELLKRGYSEADIRKICGENTLRVWSEVERVAAELQKAS